MDAGRLVEFGIWVLSLILSIVFFYNGIGKILDIPPQPDQFKALGIPHNVMVTMGVIECFGALMLTLPRLALFASALLGVVMLVNGGLFYLHDNMASAIRAVVISLVLAVIYYLRLKHRDATE